MNLVNEKTANFEVKKLVEMLHALGYQTDHEKIKYSDVVTINDIPGLVNINSRSIAIHYLEDKETPQIRSYSLYPKVQITYLSKSKGEDSPMQYDDNKLFMVKAKVDQWLTECLNLQQEKVDRELKDALFEKFKIYLAEKLKDAALLKEAPIQCGLYGSHHDVELRESTDDPFEKSSFKISITKNDFSVRTDIRTFYLVSPSGVFGGNKTIEEARLEAEANHQKFQTIMDFLEALTAKAKEIVNQFLAEHQVPGVRVPE